MGIIDVNQEGFSKGKNTIRYLNRLTAGRSVYQNISVLKFANDGTVKFVGRDLEECLFYLNLAMDSIEYWASCWHMVINCDANKTEIILCFNSSDHAGIPNESSRCHTRQ